jgi:hypothetical protein
MKTGLRAENVVTVPLDLMPDRYRATEARNRFYTEVLRNVGAIPGVDAAAITSRVDLVQHGLGYRIRIEGAPDMGPQHPGARGRSVSPGYFGTVGIPLLRGHTFSERDSISAPRVMMVNEAFAKSFFPGQDPIGKRVTYSTDRIVCEIVGLARDVRSSLTRVEAEPTLYLSAGTTAVAGGASVGAHGFSGGRDGGGSQTNSGGRPGAGGSATETIGGGGRGDTRAATHDDDDGHGIRGGGAAVGGHRHIQRHHVQCCSTD